MTMYKVVLFTLMATIQVVSCQLTPSVQKHLLNLANEEITKQLVNGSDDKQANLSYQTYKSLESIVQAGQIISYLSDTTPKNQAVCKWLSDAKLEEQASSKAIYYKAEAQAQFKCSESGKFYDKLNKDIKNMLDSPSKYFGSVDDVYHAYLIDLNSKAYGFSATEALKQAVDSHVTKQFSKDFDSDTFSLKGQEMSVDSFKILEMMSHPGANKASSLLEQLVNLTGSTSTDVLSENRIFFVAPKAAKNPQNFDLTEVNLHVLKSIMDMDGMYIKDGQQMSHYKNYFMNKVIGHQSVSSVRNALQGLLLLKDQVFLQGEGKSYLMIDKEMVDTLKFNVVDYLGNKASIKKVVQVEMIETDDMTKVQKLGSKFQLVNGGSQLSMKFDDVAEMKWASYALKFQLEGTNGNNYFVTKLFQVKAKIYNQPAVSFAQTEGWDYPEKYQVNSGFPVEFDQHDTSTYPIIHIQIDAQFFGDKDKVQWPQTLFITLQKDDQIPYSAHADYIQKIQRYQIDFDLKYLIKPAINGEYKLSLHVEDPRAVNKIDLELGSLVVNFNDGSIEATNFGVRDDFKLLDKITNYFPPEEEQKGALIPLIFSAIMIGYFFNFVGQLYANGANLSMISFSGVIFSLNYLVIIGIIVAFWIKVNLINTLWILLAVTPVTLFTMNKGLSPQDCHISGFEKKDKESGGKKSKTY